MSVACGAAHPVSGRSNIPNEPIWKLTRQLECVVTCGLVTVNNCPCGTTVLKKPHMHAELYGQWQLGGTGGESRSIQFEGGRSGTKVILRGTLNLQHKSTPVSKDIAEYSKRPLTHYDLHSSNLLDLTLLLHHW